MNRSIAVGAFVGIAVAGVVAHERASAPAYAEVVRVTPLVAAIESPRADEAAWGITEYTWGYDVRYRIGNEVGSVRIDYDPGDRIPLQGGQLPNDRHSI